MANQTIIAECIAHAGYGTAYYDPETGDCSHEAYASVEKVISNQAYWDEYESIMSVPLSLEFNLGMCFDTFRLYVTEDGERHAERVDPRL